MALTALIVLRVRNLFAVVMLCGIYSLLGAMVYDFMDAVDVAFTEAAVGAGISTVLMLATLALTTREEKPGKLIKPIPFAVVCATAALLVYATLDMPRYGDPEAPIHRHVAPHYIELSGVEVGPPNIVTSVLASYRGYDTLGEVFVIFTAAIGVLTIIGRAPGSRRGKRRKDEIDQKIAKSGPAEEGS